MLTRSDINLMAPVGSYESLQAAIKAGANSIYFGVEKLNMRARSSVNFTLDDLSEIVSICKSHGVESYLTINTILYDNEMDTMRSIVDAARAAGITAVIASDQSVIHYASEQGVEIHLSTQLNISNFEALRFYAHFADVVVLARELNLEQVKRIHEQIVEHDVRGPRGELIKIEMFCHGALCMAVSGKCYMSLHEHNHSANRGSCLQTCRKGYTVTNNESGHQLEIDNEYIMSPKDLCTLGFVDKMLLAGVRVLKIEGRARSAEYVKHVCEAYNAALDAILEGTYNRERIEELMEGLQKVFNRGFWDGYYLGQTMGEWSSTYGSSATRQKLYVAKVTNYFSGLGVAEFVAEAGSLHQGDEVLIMGPTTGVIEQHAEHMRLADGTPTTEVLKGQVFSMQVPNKVRRNDKLYYWKVVEQLS